MTYDITLESGNTLKITLSPFAVSKALYQAILEELKTMRLDPEAEVDVNLFKDLFCTGFSSKKIEACLNECFKKTLYNSVHITAETFEPVSAREDYLAVCWEVTLHNILPFTKNLSQQFSRMSQSMPVLQKSQSKTTT